MIALGAALFLTTGSAAGAADPDLEVTMLIDPPSVLPAGAEFSTAAMVANRGSRVSPGSQTRFYLSANTTQGSSDLVLGSRTTRRLAPKSESLRTLRIELPASTSPGEYFLLACADSAQKVRERVERNNCIASAYPMIVPPDTGS